MFSYSQSKYMICTKLTLRTKWSIILIEQLATSMLATNFCDNPVMLETEWWSQVGDFGNKIDCFATKSWYLLSRYFATNNPKMSPTRKFGDKCNKIVRNKKKTPTSMCILHIFALKMYAREWLMLVTEDDV